MNDWFEYTSTTTPCANSWTRNILSNVKEISARSSNCLEYCKKLAVFYLMDAIHVQCHTLLQK